MKKTNNKIKFAVVQIGFGVFGVGETERGAMTDSLEWLGHTEEGEKYTLELLENELKSRKNFHGDLVLISDEDDQFDDYLETDSRCSNENGTWVLKCQN